MEKGSNVEDLTRWAQGPANLFLSRILLAIFLEDVAGVLSTIAGVLSMLVLLGLIISYFSRGFCWYPIDFGSVADQLLAIFLEGVAGILSMLALLRINY